MPYTLTIQTGTNERRAVTRTVWYSHVEAFQALARVRGAIQRAGIILSTVGHDAGYRHTSLRLSAITKQQADTLITGGHIVLTVAQCHEEVTCLKCKAEDLLEVPDFGNPAMPRAWRCEHCRTWNELPKEG